MPQVKQNFVGDRLDKQMPSVLHDRMNPEEWNHFVREINTAIRDAQAYMRYSPWLICCLVCVAIMVILLDIALSQSVFGNVQVGTITLSAFVVTGVLIICYLSVCRPTNYCENEVEWICEEYCDPERDIFFFYRHHNNMVHVTENRYYIEVFVGDLPELPQKEGIQEETFEDIQRETSPEWADDAIPVEEPQIERLLLTAGTADTVTTTALTISTQDSRSTAKPIQLMAGPSSSSQELVPRGSDVYSAGPGTGMVQVFPQNTPRGGTQEMVPRGSDVYSEGPGTEANQVSPENISRSGGARGGAQEIVPRGSDVYRAGPGSGANQVFPQNTSRSGGPRFLAATETPTEATLVPVGSPDIAENDEDDPETALVQRGTRDIV